MSIEIEAWVKLAAFAGAGFSMGLGAIGAAVGEGYAAAKANAAISEKPDSSGDIVKMMLVGQAIAETAAIFALVIAVLLLFAGGGAVSIITASALMGAGLSMGLGAIGSGVGAGLPAGQACAGLARQPELSRNFTTTMLIGAAVSQTPAIFAMVIAFMLMFINFAGGSLHMVAALFGAGLCMGFGAIGSGVGSGFPAGEACAGLARQPAMGGQLTTNMLIGAAVSQTPAIFAMVVAFMLMFMNFSNLPLHPASAALLGAGLATGLAAIGSGVGSGLAAGAGCEGWARNPLTTGNVLVIMLVGQAVSQTPSIFGLLISFVLMFKSYPATEVFLASTAVLSAGLCMGLGGIGSGVGNGMTAQSAVSWVARNVEQEGVLMRTMLVGQAVSQSTAIYAMVIALALIFLV
ncbi:MAG: ATP synthase F0 subunit C [Desulfobacteraceae bacterium]|nr:ATP synthase F0 subunit C [Desulfobacteraceae bacterium]